MARLHRVLSARQTGDDCVHAFDLGTGYHVFIDPSPEMKTVLRST